MPNGTRGDHPITDILVYNLETFSPEVDDLFRQIYEIGGWEGVNHVWDQLESDPELHYFIWTLSSHANEEALEKLERRLTVMRDQLKQDADSRGSETKP